MLDLSKLINKGFIQIGKFEDSAEEIPVRQNVATRCPYSGETNPSGLQSGQRCKEEGPKIVRDIYYDQI